MSNLLIRTWIFVGAVAGAGAGVAVVAGPASAQTPVRLSIGEAVRRASVETAPVALAGLEADQAEANFDDSRSALLPSIEATGSMLNRTLNVDAFGISIPREPGTTHNPLAGPFANFDARLHLSQTLFDAAALLQTRAAREVVTGREAGIRAAVEAASHRATLAYLDGSHAEAKLAARMADAELAAELLALAEEQLAAGVSAGIDVTRARAQKVAADGQVLVAQNAVQQAAIHLARAIGMEPGTRFELTDDLGSVFSTADLPLDADAAVTAAVSRRPELQQAEASHRTADAAKRAIRAERLPRVDLVADYGANGLHPSDAIATRQVGIQVSIPLFDGLGRAARLAEQSAVVRASEIQATELRQQISAEVRGALLDRSNGGEREQVALEQLSLAEEELSQARERFANGVVGNVELIDAQASLLRARDALIDAQFATSVASATLARAIGMASELR